MSSDQSSISEETILNPSERLRTLSTIGSSVSVDNSVPVIRYFRSGPQMEKMARTYYSEGQLEQAFILYNKFATLFVEKLPKHPGYSKAAPTEKARTKKLLKPSFERAMELKDLLRKKYESERNELLQQREAEEAAKSKPLPSQVQQQQEMFQPMPHSETPPTHDTTPLPSDIAPPPSDVHIEVQPPSLVNIAGQHENEPTNSQNEAEERNRNESEMEEQNKNESGYMDDDNEPPIANDMLLLMTTSMSTYDDDEEDETQPIQDTSNQHLTATDVDLAKVLPTDPPTHNPGPPTHTNLGAPVPDPTYQTPAGSYPAPSAPYPPPAASYQPPPYSQVPPNQQAPPYTPYTGSGVPYQSPYYRSSSFPTSQPPQSHQVHVPSTPPANMGVPSSYVPPIDRSSKPTTPDFDRNLKPHVLTSLGGLEGGVRTITLPDDVVSRFLQLASSNTRRDVETCGILGGKLGQNKLRITHIIIPKQRGKSDSCETLNEEDLFDVQDKHDLITLGWIHTHPSQTSFMSSVDLHTHCSYQLMLEEAIAIVCAPRYSQVGVYTLTQPYGLNYISKCSGKGFHTHPKEPPIYEECKHVVYDPSLRVEIIDLR